MATILDGRAVAAGIENELAERIKTSGVTPRLAIVQVGDDSRSAVYINKKLSFGKRIGAAVEHIRLDAGVSFDGLSEAIKDLNARADVHGIIVQMPVPEGLRPMDVFNLIDPRKDVDGLGAQSAQLALARARHEDGGQGHLPATARGVASLLKGSGVTLEGKHVVVIGRSMISGLSSGLAALSNDATVTICHSRTSGLSTIVGQADIVIVAAGKPGLVGPDMVKPHHVIVDVGISPDGDGGISGDVDFTAVAPLVSMISPVPGGVGPMTVASLFQNLCDATLADR
jgi:methylenetetrahydrofolate dehydrogenase (NADP+)/methenyltetrahydrofolate cyclohydrolase